MNRLRHLRWLLIPLVMASLAGVGWIVVAASRARALASPTRSRKANLPIPVRTVQVSQELVETVVGGTAITVASARAPIRLGSSRQFNKHNPMVTAVHVSNGAYVQTGQLLVELDAGLFERAVAEEKQNLEAARAGLTLAKAALIENQKVREVELAAAADLEFRAVDIEFRKEDYERLSRLRSDGNASLIEYLEAGAYYSRARFELSRAQLREQLAKSDLIVGPLRDRQAVLQTGKDVKSAELAVGLAENDLQHAELRAPFDGFVHGLTVREGHRVARGEVLGQLLKVDPIHVRVDYPQERLDGLAVGQEAEVELDSFPQETFAGTVVEIGVQVNEKSRALPVMVEISNPDRRIRPGISGYVRLRSAKRATTVPAVSVIKIDSEAMVFVVENGRAHIRKVTTGPVLDAGVLEVLAGLADGEEVVIYGQQYLRDNERVNTDWRRLTLRD